MTKTWKERILNAASKEEVINKSVLRKRFRIPSTEMNSEYFNGSVMRAARKLAEEKCLKRTDRGTYEITRKGEKTLAYYSA